MSIYESVLVLFYFLVKIIKMRFIIPFIITTIGMVTAGPSFFTALRGKKSNQIPNFDVYDSIDSKLLDNVSQDESNINGLLMNSNRPTPLEDDSTDQEGNYKYIFKLLKVNLVLETA